MGIAFSEARGPEGMRLYAVGDVHGRFDLLSAMHGLIEAEIARDRPADWRIIYLGDFVDRGPDSRGVLDFLEEKQAGDPRIICLMGNHEAGLLDFLARPDSAGLFMRFGGTETALSYGVELRAGGAAELRDGHAALATAMPEAHLAFLRRLPRSVLFGDFFFCHAGIRPGVPLAQQAADDLIWIREPFLRHPGLHEKVVVHGHTPTAVPEILPARVNLDTLAFHSGRLTALRIDEDEKRVFSVEAKGQSAETP